MAGKSTLAAGLFYHAKSQHKRVELVTEYAREMVYEDRSNILADQLYILAKMNRRLLRLKGKVDYVITDSPLMLGALYATPGYYPSFTSIVDDAFNSYCNINMFVKRDMRAPLQTTGRVQTEIDQMTKLDDSLANLLYNRGILFNTVHVGASPLLVWQFIENVAQELDTDAKCAGTVLPTEVEAA